jgi:hypothetical protein
MIRGASCQSCEAYLLQQGFLLIQRVIPQLSLVCQIILCFSEGCCLQSMFMLNVYKPEGLSAVMLLMVQSCDNPTLKFDGLGV